MFFFIPAPKYCVLFQYLVFVLQEFPCAKTYMHEPAMYLMNVLELNIKYRKKRNISRTGVKIYFWISVPKYTWFQSLIFLLQEFPKPPCIIVFESGCYAMCGMRPTHRDILERLLQKFNSPCISVPWNSSLWHQNALSLPSNWHFGE